MKERSRWGTQKWSDLPEVTQRVSDRAKNKKPCYFLPAWYLLPKVSIQNYSQAEMLSVFCRATASSGVLLCCGVVDVTTCKGALPSWGVSTGHTVRVGPAAPSLSHHWFGSPTVTPKNKHSPGTRVSVHVQCSLKGSSNRYKIQCLPTMEHNELPFFFLLIFSWSSSFLLIDKMSFSLCCSLVLIHDAKNIFPLPREARDCMWTWNMCV